MEGRIHLNICKCRLAPDCTRRKPATDISNDTRMLSWWWRRLSSWSWSWFIMVIPMVNWTFQFRSNCIPRCIRVCLDCKPLLGTDIERRGSPFRGWKLLIVNVCMLKAQTSPQRHWFSERQRPPFWQGGSHTGLQSSTGSQTPWWQESSASVVPSVKAWPERHRTLHSFWSPGERNPQCAKLYIWLTAPVPAIMCPLQKHVLWYWPNRCRILSHFSA